MTENYVENVFYGFLVHEDFIEAWAYLKKIKQEEKANQLLENLKKPVHFDTGYSWLNKSLNIYYTYLQKAVLERFQLAEVRENQKASFIKELQQILKTDVDTVEALEEILAAKINALSWHAKLGKSGHYYAPYIWKKERIEKFDVKMPHSTETITVHFLSEFVTKGWLSFISNDLFKVGAWVENGEIYCLEEEYGQNLNLPKFQISLLKHETQHLIDNFLKLDATHQEFRSKLVELHYYPDVSFLTFVLQEASFLENDNKEAYAFALVLQSLVDYFSEVGIENPKAYLQLCVKSPLEWVRNRGTIQQAALAILDRDTQEIMQSL